MYKILKICFLEHQQGNLVMFHADFDQVYFESLF